MMALRQFLLFSMEIPVFAKPLTETDELFEVAQSITPLQRQLLVQLAEKGPALLMELAVSVFKFPGDIGQPLHDLRKRGLVTTDPFAGTQMGSELYALAEVGRNLARLLRDPNFAAQVETTRSATPAALPAVRPDQQEIDLLQKLGDAALQQDDAAKASDYYKQALELARASKGAR